MNRLLCNTIRLLVVSCLLATDPLLADPAADDRAGNGGWATFTVDTELDGVEADGLWVTLVCGDHDTVQGGRLIPPQGTELFELSLREDEATHCSVRVQEPGALLILYRGDGGSQADIADDGCHFSGVRAGHANFCQIRSEVRETSVTVYKKWIGTTRAEDDVSLRLVCLDGFRSDESGVNAGRPARWALNVTDPAGVLCHVEEQAREDFISDAEDCRDLLVLPGAQEECTLVNTKVVKMIEMLNRYGLFVMIFVFLVAGMLASRKFMP